MTTCRVAHLLGGVLLTLTVGCVFRTGDENDVATNDDTNVQEPPPPSASPGWPTKPSPRDGSSCVGMLAVDAFGKLYVTQYLCQGPGWPLPDPADDPDVLRSATSGNP